MKATKIATLFFAVLCLFIPAKVCAQTNQTVACIVGTHIVTCPPNASSGIVGVFNLIGGSTTSMITSGVATVNLAASSLTTNGDYACTNSSGGTVVDNGIVACAFGQQVGLISQTNFSAVSSVLVNLSTIPIPWSTGVAVCINGTSLVVCTGSSTNPAGVLQAGGILTTVNTNGYATTNLATASNTTLGDYACISGTGTIVDNGQNTCASSQQVGFIGQTNFYPVSTVPVFLTTYTGNKGATGATGATGPTGPPGPSSPSGLGNQVTVCDVTTPTCNGVSFPSTTELGTLFNACTTDLPSTGGTCDARGLSSPVTWSTNITNTKNGVEYILPAGVINRGTGVQWQLTNGWMHIHGSGFQAAQTNIVSGGADTSSVFSKHLVGYVEMDHFKLSGGVPLFYQMEVWLTQTYIHDFGIYGPGWGLNLADGGGCNCYNTFSNNNFYNVRTGGNTNYNNWFANSFGQSGSQTGYALNIADGYMQKFDGVSIENIPNSIYVSSTVHDLTVRNFNFENDGANGSGALSTLPIVQPGAHRISFLGGADIVDLSGDPANSFGSQSYLPIQSIWPGKFSQTKLGSSGFIVNTHTSYYGTAAGATMPSATWFSGGDFSIVAWVYPTYPTAFYSSAGYQIVANWGTGTNADRVVLLLNGLTPVSQIFEGTNYTLKQATSPIIAQQWNQVVITQTGGNTNFYINGSLINSLAQWSPNNVTRSNNYISSPSGVQPLFASVAELAVYNTALSGTNVSNQYSLGTGSSGYEAGIIAGTYGGAPIALYPLSDLPTSLTLTSVSVVGGVATYNGTITGGGSNAFANYTFTVTGFSNAVNNGVLTCTASTGSTLTLVNTAAVNESAAAIASYAKTAIEAIASANGTYTGPTILGSVTGIPGDQGSTQYAATFGGTTSYEYFIGFTDPNGGVTLPSSGVYVGNFSPLTRSTYNTTGVQSWPLGAKYATIYKGDTSHALGLWVPTNSTFSDLPTGGSLSPNTAYYYRVTATNQIGTTTASTETSLTTANDGNSTHQVTVTALVDVAALGCKVYGRSTGTELLLGTGTLAYAGSLMSQTCTFTDTGSGIPSGALPGTNTAAIAFVASNVGVNDDGTRPSVSVTAPTRDTTGDAFIPGALSTTLNTLDDGSGNISVSGDVNVATSKGFKINSTATSTHYLRGNGTRYVDSAIQSGDLPSSVSFTGITGLTSPFTPNAAGGTTIGSALLPFGSLYLGTAATNNAIFTPATFGQATTYTVPDPGVASVAANGIGLMVESCGATSGATQNCAKTAKFQGIAIFGNVTLNGAATQAITTLPFSSSSSYSCWGSDFTNAAGIVSFSVYTSGASATIKESGGGTSDVLYWGCVGF